MGQALLEQLQKQQESWSWKGRGGEQGGRTVAAESSLIVAESSLVVAAESHSNEL